MAKLINIAMIIAYHNFNIQETAFGTLPDADCSVNIVKVAEVATDSLEEAFSLTNHIDGNWTRNPEVIAEPGKHRSTCVGKDTFFWRGNLAKRRCPRCAGEGRAEIQGSTLGL